MDFSAVYFIDGVQRTVLLGEINSKPLFLHMSGAAIMRREGKVVTSFGEPEMQVRFISEQEIGLDSKIPLEIVSPENPSSFYSHSSFLREQLERRVLKKTLRVATQDEAVIYDGRLVYPEALTAEAEVIGVIKRHSSLYLKDKKVFYSLKPGERTSSFVLEFGEEPMKSSVVSFYQKLFPSRGSYYGLVRVEVPQSKVKSSNIVNDFAGFIFSERFPINFTTHQSGKKLYPISVCEKFLSSKLPSLSLVSAFLSDVLQ